MKRICVNIFLSLTVIAATNFFAWSVLASSSEQKFFPLKREAVQQGAKPVAKFLPLNKGKPMKLMFSSSKKPIIYANDKQIKPLKSDVKGATNISGGDASQLLSIYEPVD